MLDLKWDEIKFSRRLTRQKLHLHNAINIKCYYVVLNKKQIFTMKEFILNPGRCMSGVSCKTE